MTFVYPEMFWYLIVIPILAVVGYVAFVRGREELSRLLGSHFHDSFLDALTFKRFLTAFTFLLAMALLIFALADPHWGEESVEDERRGLEIVYLMDVSNSMLAEDISPDRLTRSREVARAVQSQLPDAHAAVVAFKGDSSVVSPMTEDSVAFELAMEYLASPLVSTPGTDVERALGTAAALFPSGTNRRKVILLFSDGQELTGDQRTTIRLLRDSDITVVTVVVGTAAGALVPLSSGGVLRDQSGNPVVVGVDAAALELVAEETGGVDFRIDDANVVNRVVTYLETLSARGESVVFRVVGTARYRLFLVLALLSLTAGVLVETRRWSGQI